MKRALGVCLRGKVVRSLSKVSRISTSKAPEAIGPYSQATSFQNIVFVSGQLGTNPEDGEFAGQSTAQQTKQALQNLEAILDAAGSGMGSVLKTTVLLAEMGDFQEMNEVYAKAFEGMGFPARACFACKDLPKGGRVEIEAVAVKEEQL